MINPDEPQVPSAAEVIVMLDESEGDIEAGRTVLIETVLASLDASIARMEDRTAKRAIDAD